MYIPAGMRNYLKDDPDFYPVFFEGIIVARQSRVVNETVKDFFYGFRLALESGFQDAIDRGIISPSISSYGLASVINGLIDGMGLQMLLEPELLDDEEIWTALRQSILKRAFEGRLVPQNPNDEPAEKLLKMIKAEKAKYEVEQKPKKKTKRKVKPKQRSLS